MADQIIYRSFTYTSSIFVCGSLPYFHAYSHECMCYYRTTTSQRLLQGRHNVVYLKQYFGWPDQPSSGLAVISKPEEGLRRTNVSYTEQVTLQPGTSLLDVNGPVVRYILREDHSISHDNRAFCPKTGDQKRPYKFTINNNLLLTERDRGPY